MANKDPFKDMKKGFDDFFEPRFSSIKTWEPFERIKFSDVRTPLVNVLNKGKTIVVTVELPGVDKKDVSVDATEDYIKIDAEAKHIETVKKDNYYRQERSYKSFSRTISMPEKIKPEKVGAEFKNGVLELTAPKAKVHKPKIAKKIKID